MIGKEILSKLISIGKKEDIEALHKLFPANQVEKQGEIMRLHWQTWYPIADNLSNEELIALIKSLTIAERALQGWQGGNIVGKMWLELGKNY